MSSDLQGRIDDLRRRAQRLGDEPDAETVAELERAARGLLADAKNTAFEPAAQALFAELARMSNPTSPTAATVRGLVRRARIRIEIAGDEDDIDEAIDILAEALALNPRDGDVIALMQEAANRSQQANQRVTDLFSRYGVQKPATPPPPPPQSSQPEREVYPNYPTSSGYPPPETQMYQEAPSSGRRPGQGPLYAGSDIDEALTELTQLYYAGDYQQTVDVANRILTQQPGNPTALEYRQKAEDNLIRGVVPDHRIPFDARVAYNRANSLVRAGNYEEAERLYREARDLAERSGILSWKDAEQALLEIQDLALARELLNEGDRLMATDNWSEALRKYEGALRVVPNDPMTEDRIETVRRVQQDTDQAAMQLSMLSGSLQDQVLQLQNITGILTRIRQRLPNSQRLNQLYQESNERLNGIKTYLNDQAQAALTRANGATSLEERLSLTNEALHLLELGVKLAPGDSNLSEMMLEARSDASDMQRARQVIERASVLIAQNFDNELTQARSMLAGLRDYAQDERYRTVVSDLLSRYVERAEQAIEDGDISEAQSWLDALREEPFRILGRRSEVLRVENALRGMHQRGRVRSFAVIIIIIIFVALGILASRPIWVPLINPPATPTPSITPTFTDTATPTSTYTPTTTATSSLTPSPTGTATPTYTPSWTVTPSLTPTDTPSPTHTPTITPTFTPSTTPTITDTPSVTPTQPVLCRVFVQNLEGVNVRSRPTTLVPRVGVIPRGTAMDVLRQELGPNDGRVWFFVNAEIEGAVIQGWLRGDTVIEITNCPPLP